MQCSVLLLALSLHLNTEYKYNEIHPGVGLECDKYSTGIYENSLKETSVWAARRFKNINNFFIEAGFVTGYNYKGKEVLPFTRIGYDAKYADLFIVPGIEKEKIIPVLGIQFKY